MWGEGCIIVAPTACFALAVFTESKNGAKLKQFTFAGPGLEPGPSGYEPDEVTLPPTRYNPCTIIQKGIFCNLDLKKSLNMLVWQDMQYCGSSDGLASASQRRHALLGGNAIDKTQSSLRFVGVAQSVERRTHKPQVTGSIPVADTIT